MRVAENNLKYVLDNLNGWSGRWFRFRVWLGVKIMPNKLNHFGRLWAVGIHSHAGSKLTVPYGGSKIDEFQNVQPKVSSFK